MSDEVEGYGGHDLPPEFQRAFASRVLSRIDQHQEFARDQVASMAKWLMASLLAVNGGGAIAAMNAMASGKGHWLAGLLFALGVGFALLSGVAMQDVYNGVPEPLLAQDDYWTAVSIQGQRDGAKEAQLKAGTAAALRWAWLPPALGWVSGLLFLAGAISIAFHHGDDEKANAARCQAIQRDMLSARPARSDDAALFTALGCVPTGHQNVAAPARR